jgi:K+-sensing histidine kinase KdpD
MVVAAPADLSFTAILPDQVWRIVPHRKIEYRGKTFEEMDTEAVLRSVT